MASKKSAANPHQWPDGSWHSITWSQHQINTIRSKGLNPNPTGAPVLGGNPAPTEIGAPAKGNAPGPVIAGALPQPFDPAYEAQKQSATWNIQISDADAGHQKNQLAYGSGYNADGTRNTANPYAQAQLLEDSWRRSVMGSDNSMAAAGQYSSGARLNAQARNDREYAQGSDQLKRGTADQYYGIGRGQLQTYASNGLGTNSEAFASLKRSVYGS